MRPFLMILLSVVGGWLAYQLRVVHLFEPEWLDERHTAWVLSGGWGSIWERAALGNQPALYFAGLKLLGLSDVSPGWLLRLPSLLANLLLVVGLPCGLYLWTRRVSAALVSCAMLAVQSDLLYYATEARVYGVLTTVALLQILVVAARLDWRDWAMPAARRSRCPRGEHRSIGDVGLAAFHGLVVVDRRGAGGTDASPVRSSSAARHMVAIDGGA
ncbi:MAG: hypothetical protein R3B96_06000 [Pirellulaceae bacterium]